MLFFTADTHFGSERTLNLSKRPFASVEEMDNEMIKNWNRVVGPDDNVFHLGDFGNLDVISELNGNIHLCAGNYERLSDREAGLTIMRRLEFYKKAGFADYFTPNVCVFPIEKYLEWNSYETCPTLETLCDTNNMDISKMNIAFMHEPSNHRKPRPGSHIFNLYGHIHGRQMVRRYGMDVGVDAHHFFPISLDDVFFYWNAILNFYDHEVFDD